MIQETLCVDAVPQRSRTTVRVSSRAKYFCGLQGNHLEEQVGLLAAHRQIADLVDDQQFVGVDRAVHDLTIAALALRGFECTQTNSGSKRPSATS
jgi:hypothetical protein